MAEFQRNEPGPVVDETSSEHRLRLAPAAAGTVAATKAAQAGFCEWTAGLLEADGLDVADKVLGAMLVGADLCRGAYERATTTHRLQSLVVEWESEEDADVLELTTELAHTAKLLLKHWLQ